MIPERQVRARHDSETIRVYQAYGEPIARPAVEAQRFVPPFKIGRMTWIKPSFCWMMYRCGFAAKQGQECVLAMDVRRQGFEWALRNAALSHFDPAVHPSSETWTARRDTSPVRVQWDPERDIMLERLPYRSIQVGLGGEAVRRYIEEWIVCISDVTDLASRLGSLEEERRREMAKPVVTAELPYELPLEVTVHLMESQNP